MSNEINATTTSATEVATKKVIRRGIGSARGTERLKFTHELAKPNGLFTAHLDSVEVRKITIGEDKTGMPSFNGMEIPQIVFTFASNEPEANRRHYATLRFTAVESNAETIPGGKKAWTVSLVFDWFKHILDVFVLKGRDLTEEEEVALSLPFEDFDEQGEYVPVEPETVAAGWTSMFENLANILKTANNGKPAYQDVNGKPLPLWIKLLRYQKQSKGKVSKWAAITNGDLAFPQFVGEGCIELYKQNVPASIRLNAVKEAIIPMKIEESKAPNMPMAAPGMSAPMMGGGIAVGGSEMNNPYAPGVDAMAAAADDMPF